MPYQEQPNEAINNATPEDFQEAWVAFAELIVEVIESALADGAWNPSDGPFRLERYPLHGSTPLKSE